MEFLNKYDKSIFIIFLFGILLCVAALFLWNINDHGFWKDELYHALGAKYILSEGEPVFPTGDIYSRAMGYTYLVALSYKVFGISELAGRLPSFVFMIPFLVTSGFLVRRLFGTFPALLFVLVLGLSPLSIELARFSRMYTTFAFLYFFGAWFFFFGIERNALVQKNSFWLNPVFDFEIKFDINLKLLLLSGVLFFISRHMHKLTLTFVVAMGSFILLKFLGQILNRGIPLALRSKYGVLVLSGIACIPGMLVLIPDFLIGIQNRITWVPLWAENLELGSNYYRVFLSESYPFFFFAYPVAAIYVIQKYRNIGLFLVANFFVLLLLHSFVFEMKQLRYFYYILPFFFMTVVLFSIDLVKNVWNHIEKVPRFDLVWVKGGYLLAMLVFLNVFTFPWLNEVKNLPRKHPDVNWKAFSQKAIPLMSSNVPVLATDQLTYLYYFNKKPDYYLRLNYYDVPGDAEFYAGSIPITSFEEFRSLSERESNLYIVSKRGKLSYAVYSNDAIRQFINEHFEQIKLDGIDKIRLFQKKIRDTQDQG